MWESDHQGCVGGFDPGPEAVRSGGALGGAGLCRGEAEGFTPAISASGRAGHDRSLFIPDETSRQPCSERSRGTSASTWSNCSAARNGPTQDATQPRWIGILASLVTLPLSEGHIRSRSGFGAGLAMSIGRPTTSARPTSSSPPWRAAGILDRPARLRGSAGRRASVERGRAR